MRSAFICRRPIQLMTIMNIIVNRIENVDFHNNVLFFLDYPEVYENVNFQVLNKYFSKIYVIHENNPRKTSILDLKYFSYKRKPLELLQDMYGSVDIKDFQGYDKIFGTYLGSFLVALSNVNPEAEVVFFDNGVFCYIRGDDSRCWKPEAKIRYKITQLFFETGPMAVCPKCLYVYDPRLVIEPTSYEIRKLPCISGYLLEILKSVFYNLENRKNYLGRKVIFLSQPLSSKECDFDETVITNLIEQYSPNYVYRKHPKQKNVVNDHLDYSNPMWELVINDLDEGSLLVSYASTGLFTPCTLYLRKNPIVYLNKLLFKYRPSIIQPFDKFVERIREEYGGIVYYPNTLNEFEEILKIWSEKVKTKHPGQPA